MKFTIITTLLLVPLAAATDNTQLVQTNVNVQNVELEKSYPEPESVTSQIAIQEVSVNQDVSVPPSPPPPPPPPPPSPSANSPPVPDPQNVQLLKEANAQYQYQINSRYEEKTRPVYGDAGAVNVNSQYNQQPYSYLPVPMYPYYKENTQYQELGNGQRRAESNVVVNDGVRAQYENQDQSSYSHQRSQSYSEYGKGEVSPDYNTYSYKRTYY